MKTVYLDQNQLSYLAKVSPPVDQEIRSRFDRAVQDRRLTPIVSSAHIVETLAAHPKLRRKIARYVTSLRPLWLRSWLDLVSEDVARAAAIYFGWHVDPPRSPFQSDMEEGLGGEFDSIISKFVRKRSLLPALWVVAQKEAAGKAFIMTGELPGRDVSLRNRLMAMLMIAPFVPESRPDGRRINQKDALQFLVDLNLSAIRPIHLRRVLEARIALHRSVAREFNASVAAIRERLPEGWEGLAAGTVRALAAMGRSVERHASPNDMGDVQHALAYLYCDAYLPDKKFADYLKQEKQQFSQHAECFSSIKELLEWLPSESPNDRGPRV